MERNRYLVMLQNYKVITLVLLLPAILLMEIMMLLYSFIRAWSKEKIKANFYFLNINSWLKILKARKAVQKTRQINDREIFKRFVGQIKFQELDNKVLKYFVNPIFNLLYLLIKEIIFW